MVANIDPIFIRQSQLSVAGSILGNAANTATDGTGANMFQIFVADATEGSFVQRVDLVPIANPAATVIRLWYCTDTGTFTAGTTNTAANTTMLGELTFPGWPGSNNVSNYPLSFLLELALPPSTKLLMSFGTATGASTGFNPLIVAGKY